MEKNCNEDDGPRSESGDAVLARKRHTHVEIRANVYEKATHLLEPLDPQPPPPVPPVTTGSGSYGMGPRFFNIESNLQPLQDPVDPQPSLTKKEKKKKDLSQTKKPDL